MLAAIVGFGTVGLQPAGADAAPVESVSASSLPANWDSTSNWTLNGSACGSESCVAVGWYEFASSHNHGLIVPITDGIAGAGTQVSLPAGAVMDNTQDDGLRSVSCWSSASCVAVGYYTDSGGNFQGFVVPITDGVPGTPQEVQPPGAGSPNPAGSNPYMSLQSVSCTTSGACVAVGYYSPASGGAQGVAVPINGGVAGAGIEVPAPADSTSSPNVDLVSVSCQTSGSCVAVGDYFAGSSPVTVVALVVPIIGGSPGTAAPMTSLPANADSTQGAQLTNVACPATGTCSAIGYYYDSASNQHDLVVPITNGLAGNGVEAPSPADGTGSSAFSVDFYGLACQSTGACVAVGSYGTADGTEPVAIPIANGVPAAADRITLPSDAVGSGQYARIFSVACPTTGPCLAGGEYRNTNGNGVPLTAAFDGGSVGSGVEAAEPSDESTSLSAFGVLDTVGCTTFSCATAGSYSNTTSQAPFVLSAQAPLAVAPSSLPAGTVGTSYTQALSATGAWGAYSDWSVTSGSLPSGLILNAQTGVISGTPTVVGTSTFSVGISSTTGVPLQTATRSYSLEIAAVPPTSAPTSTPAPAPAAATPRLTLVGRSVMVIKNRFGLKLRCAVAACRGTAKLQIGEVVTVKHGGRRVRKHVTVVIASVSFSLSAGQTHAYRVTLRAAGRRALALDHRLRATVLATVAGIRQTVGHLTLKAPAAKKTR